jgi:hypothetical protein
MSDNQFTDTLIQAINDWQRGGDAKQKARRGLALKEACQSLDPRFRRTTLVCFRQISVSPSAVWQLHDKLGLSETISAWTLTTDVAKAFKGGVPPAGNPGLILDIVPPEGSVIVNLDALYREPAFVAACEAARNRISAYGSGIAAYGNSQNEVVLELESVPMSSVYALGGHSSSREMIAEFYFGHPPTPDEWEEFSRIEAASDVRFGPRWITGAAKERVLTRTLEKYGILKPSHSISSSAS